MDGSNVGVARVDGQIVALGRAGYLAQTSPFEQHQLFAEYVRHKEQRFDFLEEGQRLVGEWLAQAHGTRYELRHEPFVPFDLMVGNDRMPYSEVKSVVKARGWIMPYTVHVGDPISVKDALDFLGEYGKHGALDPVEGVVYRVERDKRTNPNSKERVRVVDYLVKWVRPDKVDGKYLESISGEPAVWNWRP